MQNQRPEGVQQPPEKERRGAGDYRRSDARSKVDFSDAGSKVDGPISGRRSCGCSIAVSQVVDHSEGEGDGRCEAAIDSEERTDGGEGGSDSVLTNRSGFEELGNGKEGFVMGNQFVESTRNLWTSFNHSVF